MNPAVFDLCARYSTYTRAPEQQNALPNKAERRNPIGMSDFGGLSEEEEDDAFAPVVASSAEDEEASQDEDDDGRVSQPGEDGPNVLYISWNRTFHRVSRSDGVRPGWKRFYNRPATVKDAVKLSDMVSDTRSWPRCVSALTPPSRALPPLTRVASRASDCAGAALSSTSFRQKRWSWFSVALGLPGMAKPTRPLSNPSGTSSSRLLVSLTIRTTSFCATFQSQCTSSCCRP